jgi:hypothetical protein
MKQQGSIMDLWRLPKTLWQLLRLPWLLKKLLGIMEVPSGSKRFMQPCGTIISIFAGLGLIGLFFVAIQYASQAGWSTHINRIPLAMGQWIPVAGILSLVIWFVAKGDLFHWTHPDLYNIASPDYDKALDQKAFIFSGWVRRVGFPYSLF